MPLASATVPPIPANYIAAAAPAEFVEVQRFGLTGNTNMLLLQFVKVRNAHRAEHGQSEKSFALALSTLVKKVPHLVSKDAAADSEDVS